MAADAMTVQFYSQSAHCLENLSSVKDNISLSFSTRIKMTDKRGRKDRSLADLFVLTVLLLLAFSLSAHGKEEDEKKKEANSRVIGVSYDSRSLLINGKRELIFSGSIHYPRTQAEEWDDLLLKAKRGGLNCIQTYVFWNIHEPIKGKFNFSGNHDLVTFIKKIGEHGMWATLRIGPFIQAEWNHGGLPYWLKEEPGIIFRTDNPAFKHYMSQWVSKVINMMKENQLYASQGGPIILSQIENEYDHIKAAFKADGERYINWAGAFALSLDTGVPWLMCKQKSAPGEVINACNGRNCAETFSQPQASTKPKLWTENWTAQYRIFGDSPSQRPVEETAFAVAHWFAKNGSHVNYYMYYGGTNYDRTAASFVTTQYYDDAPLDEYGMIREPKWGHLRDLHYALALSRKALLWGRYNSKGHSSHLEAIWYEKPETGICAAFLKNNDTHHPHTIKFRGKDYYLPKRSISILPDCETVVFNTEQIVSQHSARLFVKSEEANKKLKWEMASEIIPINGTYFYRKPIEQYAMVKDTSDYLWYTTSIELDILDLPLRTWLYPVLEVLSLGHSMIVFVNGQFVGTRHGIKRSFSYSFNLPIKLNEGANHFAFLGTTVGMTDSGAYQEHRFTGLKSVVVKGLATGDLDLTFNGFHHKVGLDGEHLELFTEEGAKKAKWIPANKGQGPPVTWYKAYFDAPEGNDPVAIYMENMTKGMVWINGKSIGRYWSTFLTEYKKPTQSEYHIPRAFLKPKDNFLVIFDETGGFIDTVEIKTANRDRICSFVGENYPPYARSWKRDNKEIMEVVDDPRTTASLKCPRKKVISAVEHAAFGNPWGSCGLYKHENCTVEVNKLVEELCLGKKSCKIEIDRKLLMREQKVDPCPNMNPKHLAIQVQCAFKD
ncbi:hypothetical protein Nepgr_018203 [Nepenthes gracilis]|uniref:Beta-galactosidase n=1 Tax=Nepenthes gracilis TaxID=150966 RepID=A0AAD3XSV6_NEPGR|nr:hypothetical protein Nepgr_018203 [Nepenthes gracilis]